MLVSGTLHLSSFLGDFIKRLLIVLTAPLSYLMCALLLGFAFADLFSGLLADCLVYYIQEWEIVAFYLPCKVSLLLSICAGLAASDSDVISLQFWDNMIFIMHTHSKNTSTDADSLWFACEK